MLASMLMESAFGVPDVSNEMLGKYTHEDGAFLIAMESAADLHEIFMEGFYDMEELEFQQCRAAMEGASEDVMEGIVDTIKTKAKNAVAKIKEKILALWEKVKTFFHNVKRYFLSIFQNGADFAKKYQNELKSLKFKPFEVKMYKYTLDELKSSIEDGYKSFNDALGDLPTADQLAKFAAGGSGESIEAVTDEVLTTLEEELTSKIDDSEIKKGWFQQARDGATGPTDKNVYTISSLDEYVNKLISSKNLVKDMETIQRNGDKSFKSTLDTLKKVETKLNSADDDVSKKAVRIAQTSYKILSKTQSWINIGVNAYKSAAREMIATYKGVCTKALGPGKVPKNDK